MTWKKLAGSVRMESTWSKETVPPKYSHIQSHAIHSILLNLQSILAFHKGPFTNPLGRGQMKKISPVIPSWLFPLHLFRQGPTSYLFTEGENGFAGWDEKQAWESCKAISTFFSPSSLHAKRQKLGVSDLVPLCPYGSCAFLLDRNPRWLVHILPPT